MDNASGSGNGLIIAAFVVMVLLAGGNPVGVHILVQEMDPFWGASVRFIAAGLIFLIALFILRVPFPSGGALVGAILYGVVGFFLAFSLAFWGLRDTPPGTGGMLLALVPLLTMILARMHGLEKLHLRAVLGSLIAFTGVALLVADRVSADIPLWSLMALVASALCFAETGVLIKLTPRAHPIATNAVALSVGGLLLGVLSAATAETWIMPMLTESWAALIFLVLGGSVGVFGLYIFILGRWSASKTSYEFLLMPVVTAIYSVIFTGEVINWALIVGGFIILVGVYVGAFSGRHEQPLEPVRHR